MTRGGRTLGWQWKIRGLRPCCNESGCYDSVWRYFEGADACWFRPSRPHGDTTKTGLDTLYGAEVDVRFPPGTLADFPLGKSFGVALYRNSPQPSESLLNSGYFPADLEGSKKRALLASSFGKWDGCWARVTGVYIALQPAHGWGCRGLRAIQPVSYLSPSDPP